MCIMDQVLQHTCMVYPNDPLVMKFINIEL
jgi:hypothetical protein